MTSDNQTIKKILIVIIAFTILTIVFLYYYSVKIENGDMCNYQSLATITSNTQDDTLTNSTYYTPETVSIPTKYYPYITRVDLCVTASSNGNNILQTIDNNGYVTGRLLVNNGVAKEYCTEIPLQDAYNQENSLRCVTCNTSNNVTLQESITESSLRISSLGLEHRNKQSYSLGLEINCRLIYKQMSTIGLITIGVLLFVISLVLLIRYADEELNKGW